MGRIFKRNGHWYIDTHIKHKRYRKKVGPNKRLAEQALQQIEASALVNHFIVPPKDMLFDKLVDEYIERVSKVRKSIKWGAKRDTLTFNNFKRLFPQIKFLSEVTLQIGDQYCALRKKEGVLNSTINRELNSLKAIMTYATEREYTALSSFKKLKCLPVPKTPKGFLEVVEASKLLEASLEHSHVLGTMIALGIFAGLRKSEMVNLQWKEIDWNREQLLVLSNNEVRTKSLKSRLIPIEPNLLSILKEQHRLVGLKSLYVLCNEKGKRVLEPVKSFKAAIKKAGITKRVTLRTLRTTACSMWAMCNVPMKQVQMWMGHSDIQITSEIYSQIVPSLSESFLGRMSQIIKIDPKVTPKKFSIGKAEEKQEVKKGGNADERMKSIEISN